MFEFIDNNKEYMSESSSLFMEQTERDIEYAKQTISNED